MQIPAFVQNPSLPPGMRLVAPLLVCAACAFAAEAAREGEPSNGLSMNVVRYGEPVGSDTSAAPASSASVPSEEARGPSSEARSFGAPSQPIPSALRRDEGATARPTTGRLLLRGYGGAFLGGTIASLASSFAPGGSSLFGSNTDNDEELVEFAMTLGATGIGYMLGAVAGVASSDPRLAERGSVGWTAAGSVGGLVVGTLAVSAIVGIVEASGDEGLQGAAGLIGAAAFFSGPVVGAVVGYRLSVRDLPISVAVPPEGGVSVRWKVALR